MKRLLFFGSFLFFISSVCFALKSTKAIDPQSPEIAQILPAYLSIENALTNADVKTANLKAEEFRKLINTIQVSSLTPTQKKVFNALKGQLSLDAEHISKSDDISHQRDHFKTFSANVWTLAKTIKLSETPLYLQYCPMQKASWVSTETEIKNPYFGKSMLTCGSITGTIK